jgi:ribosomal protein RSM22 (predicted rRNA methylase)
MSQLVKDGQKLERYLKARKTPLEAFNLKLKKKEIEELILSDPQKHLPKVPKEDASEHQIKNFESRKNQTVSRIMAQKVYGWQAINFDSFQSLVYLVGRSVQDYAVLMKIFSEIQRRDPDFKPNSYFDFGSGVGTGVWAASNFWKSSIYEYYLVDTSRHMNNLCDLILRDGDMNKSMRLQNVNFRQFLPAEGVKYDIVLSAYSLFELPNLKNRLEVINNLWKKAENYLIFVEHGSYAGFQVLNETREFLMNIRNEDSFIFAPCTHEKLDCPKFKLLDGEPCNFSVNYLTHPFSRPMSIKSETFCYLVVKKGSKATVRDRWPRLIQAPLLRDKHIICRACVQDGKLQESILTKRKHGKFTYKCAKVSNWGDQLPFTSLDGGTNLNENE